MYLKRLLCELVFFSFAFSLNAQEVKELKNVKLNSGVVISGYITNSVDGGVSVTTVDGDQLWYSPTEVESIVDDPTVIEARRKAEAEEKARLEVEKKIAKEEAKAAKRAVKDAIKMKEKGLQLMVEFGYGNTPDKSDNFIEISLIPCYRFTPNLLIGIGLGYRKTDWRTSWDDFDCVFGEGLSINAKLLYNFSSRRCTPFVCLDGGYSLMTMHFEGFQGYHHSETASSIDAFFVDFDLGYMFRNRKGSGFVLALTALYSPAPKGIHGIPIYDSIRPGIKLGWTF